MFDLLFCPTNLQLGCSVYVIVGASVQNRCASFQKGVSESSLGFPSFLLFIRKSKISPSSFAAHHEERRSREKFEFLLQVALYLIFDDGILVALNKNTSAFAAEVTRCHVSVATGTPDLVRDLQKFECFDIAWFFDDLLGVRRMFSSFWEHISLSTIRVRLFLRAACAMLRVNVFGVGSARWPDGTHQSGVAHGFSLIPVSGVVVDEGKTGGKAKYSGTPRSDMVRGWDDFGETHRIAQTS